MTDLTPFTEAKSDQLNADDLLAGPRTVTITQVRGVGGDQPVIINFEGDSGKPFKPCKSMLRVMVAVWGPDGSTFPGKSMTLYNDPEVAFGGVKTGGIRISHMSGISERRTMSLTKTRGKKAPYTVQPLKDTSAPDRTAEYQAEARAAAEKGTEAFTAWYTNKDAPDQIDKQDAAKLIADELKATATKADEAAKGADDTFADMTGGGSKPDQETNHSEFIAKIKRRLGVCTDLADIDEMVDQYHDKLDDIEVSDPATSKAIDGMIAARRGEVG